MKAPFAPLVVAVLAFVAFASCVESVGQVPPENPGCPPAALEIDPAADIGDTAFAVIVLQSCDYSGTAPRLRVRHPGSAGLQSLAAEIAGLTSSVGAPTETHWFEGDEILGGAVPIGGLDAADIRRLRLPVIVISLGNTSSDQRVAFVTNFESLEASPREPDPGDRQTPSPSVDLSASGTAVLLAAALNLTSTTANLSHRIDLLLFSGELGYRGWPQLTFLPFGDRMGGAEYWDRYAAIIGIQNVAGCTNNYYRRFNWAENAREASLFAALRERAETFGLLLNESPLLGEHTSFDEFGAHGVPGSILAARNFSSTLVAGGWWGGLTNAGLRKDNVQEHCPATLEAFARFARHTMEKPPLALATQNAAGDS